MIPDSPKFRVLFWACLCWLAASPSATNYATAQEVNCFLVSCAKPVTGDRLDGTSVLLARGEQLHQYEVAPNFFVCYYRGQLTMLDPNNVAHVNDALPYFSDPNSPSDLAIQGEIHLYRKDFAAARDSAGRALKINEKFVPAMLVMANAEIQQKKYANSRTWIERALQAEPQNAKAWSLEAIVCYHEKQFDEALAHVERAIELNPFQSTWYNNKGLFLLQNGQTEQARACFDKGIEIDPGHWHGWHCKASNCSEPDKQRELRIRALECGPNTFDPAYQLARGVRQDGNIKEYFRLMRESTGHADCPVHIKNQFAMALACCPLDEFRDGKVALKIALELIEPGQDSLSGRVNIQFLKTLAAAYAETGDFATALESMDHYVDTGIRDPEIDAMYDAFELGEPYRQSMADY